MILSCPECQTRYQADATQFPQEGRKVRCAKCGHVWHQAPPEPDPAPGPPASVPEQANFDPGTQGVGQEKVLRTPARSWSERLGLLAGWATLGAVLVLIGWTGFRFREQISTLWPQTSSLFATFGVAANAHGIAIDDTSYRRETEHGQPVWVVSGKLVNRSSHELAVPPVRVALTGKDQRELYHWTVRPPQRVLKPGQSLGFSARIPSPPPGARQVQLGFAGPE
jgi:predicted Zn finger-like uncharacterized protein